MASTSAAIIKILPNFGLTQELLLHLSFKVELPASNLSLDI